MTRSLAASAEPPAAPETGPSRIVLVGPPNVGKSALFGALTGNYVTVSNYPGTTVEISSGWAQFAGRSLRVLDTAGIHSFIPSSEDERVTRDLLLERPVDAVVAVGDAKNLERALLLALQLSEMELPFLLCLNMSDEAQQRGIRIDHEALSERLGVEVVPTVAIERKGLVRLRRAVQSPRAGRVRVAYPAAIERALERIAPLLPRTPIAPRSLALMVLAGDETLVRRLRGSVPRADLAVIEDVRQALRRRFTQPVSYVINRARIDAARSLASDVVERDRLLGTARRRIAARIERLSIHPLWGIPVLGLVLWTVYQFVGVFGAGTLVGLLEEGLFGTWINPAATALVERTIPWDWARDLLVGPYGVITMALTYALALILPIVGTFFIAFGVLEDSGYLPRLAVLVNRAFKRMGLNGKAVLPMALGLGCVTMATLTTRILESRKERLIVTLLLALGVPCSAQLTVILAMLGSLSLVALGIWLVMVTGVIVLVGALAARVLPGRGSDFVLELPPLRVPRLKNILIKTLARIEWYLKEAVPLFVLGTLLLFVADRTGVLVLVERAAEPVLTGLLGLPRETAGVFIIGFLRRDFGVAGLYQMAQAGAIDALQSLVAVVTVTLFIPCVAAFFMIVKERGWRSGLAISAFIFPFALGVGAVLNWLLRLLALPLG